MLDFLLDLTVSTVTLQHAFMCVQNSVDVYIHTADIVSCLPPSWCLMLINYSDIHWIDGIPSPPIIGQFTLV